MASIDKTLLERAVDEALRQGANYAEARYHLLSQSNILIVNGALMGVGEEYKRGVAIRVIVDGGLGFASATRLDRDSVQDAVKRAVSSARASSRYIKKPIEMGPGRIGRAKYSVVVEKKFEDESLDAKINKLLDTYKNLELEKNSFKIASFTIVYTERLEEKLIINSDGGYVESTIPRLAVFYNIAGVSGEKRANRFNMVGGTGGAELYEKLRVRDTMEDDINSLYTNLVKARSPPRGRMDVILSPELVGLIVHESAGHPSEADRILGREAAQAGMSFRTFYREDTIGNENATVIDDPTIPESYGFYLYDDETVAAGPRIIYGEGKLVGMLHNRETAAIYGVESNAASRAMDYESEPIIRMANTYLKPGDYRFEELLEDVREGVYVRKFMEWNIDDIRWGQRYVGLEAYIVRNGELAEPVRDVALEFTTKEFYSSIDAVGRDLEFSAATCGKGEPGQGVPVGTGGPHIRLKNIRVG